MRTNASRAAVLGCIVWLCGCGGDAAPEDAGGRDAAPSADAAADAGGDAASGTDAALPAIDASVIGIDAIVAMLERGDAAAIDEAAHAIAWGSGWPLEQAGRWLFVTRLEDRPSSVALAGHINAWSTTQHPAMRSPDGVHYWVVIPESEFVVPARGSKYKWHLAADDSYRAPLEATQYGFDEFGRYGWVRAPLDQPHLEQFPDFRSAHLDEPRAFRAYLPAGFVPLSAAAAAARTLLLHDGQNVFHPDAFFGGWRVDEALAARGTDIVGVAVDNASDRMDAYTHTTDDIGDGSAVGGRADDYLALLSDEALPFFRARYGIAARGRSLMVAGSSLGGLVTLRAALTDLAEMGCGAALSSTVGWGSIAAGAGGESTILRQWSGRHAALYVDSGGGVTGACVDRDADGVEDDADDGDNYCVNVQMVGVLEASGYARGSSLAYVWDVGAEHNEAAWASRIGGALDACSAMGWVAP